MGRDGEIAIFNASSSASASPTVGLALNIVLLTLSTVVRLVTALVFFFFSFLLPLLPPRPPQLSFLLMLLSSGCFVRPPKEEGKKRTTGYC